MPGRPFNSKFSPANNLLDKDSNSSFLPRIRVSSGNGPIARLSDLAGKSDIEYDSILCLPNSVMCTTVLRREPPPITWAIRVEIKSDASNSFNGV